MATVPMLVKIDASDLLARLAEETLKPGDIIQHRSTGESYVVTANYGDYAIAVRTVHVSNPDEWLVVGRSVIGRGER